MSQRFKITVTESDIGEIDRDQHKYKIKKEIDNKVKQIVISKIFDSKLFGLLNSMSKTSLQSISWKPHNKFATDPSNLESRFPYHQYAMVNPENMVKFHNKIGHNVDHVTDERVQSVADEINNSNGKVDIPTPPLAYKPVDYKYPGLDGVHQVQYEPIFEGRTRSAGAKRAGINKMPVLVSSRRIKR